MMDPSMDPERRQTIVLDLKKAIALPVELVTYPHWAAIRQLPEDEQKAFTEKLIADAAEGLK